MTLVELVVAMTLTVLVAGSTVAIVRGVTAARQRVDHRAAVEQDAWRAAWTIEAALRNAYRSTGDEWFLEGIQESNGDMPADRIRFFTVSGRDLRPGQPECDVKECEFALSSVEGEPQPVLMRRMDPARNDPPRGGGILERVAGGIVALEFAYHDGEHWQSPGLRKYAPGRRRSV